MRHSLTRPKRLEPANRTLEEVNLLFTSDSLLVKRNMAVYQARLDAANGDIAVAEKNLFDEVNRLAYKNGDFGSGTRLEKEKNEQFAVEEV